jgi:hypothetical protein
MQAKLPDVNAAIVRHRSSASKGFETGNAELAIVSIGAINALLPAVIDGKNYKVEIDSEKYYRLKAETREILCHKCDTQNSLIGIKTFWLELNWYDAILSSIPKEKVWVCKNCHKSNVWKIDDITITKDGEPYFYQCMPAPPLRQSGIRGRMTFLSEFQKWYSIAIGEIESQIGIYRSEYLSQQDVSEIQVDIEEK